jgi:sugar fermentation stimulation protein A
MKYNNIIKGKFINRPNRFLANVLLNDKIELVHVKNTGRCKEILTKGTTVILEKSNNPNRKTKYSLIGAYKNDVIINIDSQAPNQVVYDAIIQNKIQEFTDISFLKREVCYNNSRFDLYFEKNSKKGFIEVKGVTLENSGITMFPDAPTLRGTKHLLELINAVKNGYIGYIFFLIQIENIKYFTPNKKMDEDFYDALKLASKNEVHILAYNSILKEDEISIGKKVEILL